MKYSVKQLATMYSEDLSQRFLDVTIPAQTFDPSTYNEYTYQQLIKQFDTLYQHTDSFELSEKFLKGD